MNRLAWVLVMGWLVAQWTDMSSVSGQLVTTCVYDTHYGKVRIVLRGMAVCAVSRQIDVE